MQSNHTIRLILLLCICLQMRNISFSQTNPDTKAYKTEKAVVIYAGGGLSYFIGKAGTPSGFQPVIDKLHPIGMLRVMWHPGNLLHAGLETGWLRFYSYTIDDNGNEGKTEISEGIDANYLDIINYAVFALILL